MEEVHAVLGEVDIGMEEVHAVLAEVGVVFLTSKCGSWRSR